MVTQKAAERNAVSPKKGGNSAAKMIAANRIKNVVIIVGVVCVSFMVHSSTNQPVLVMYRLKEELVRQR